MKELIIIIIAITISYYIIKLINNLLVYIKNRYEDVVRYFSHRRNRKRTPEQRQAAVLKRK